MAEAYRGNRFAGLTGDLVSWLLFLFFGGVIAAMLYLVVTSMNF